MMKTAFVLHPKHRKEVLIEDVKRAIEVCYTSPDNPDEGYAFATGYARSCLQTVLGYLIEQQEQN